MFGSCLGVLQSVLGFYLGFFMFWDVLCFTGVLGWRFYLLLGVLVDFW